LELVRAASPAGGGSVGTMLMPLRAALDLAATADAPTLERVKALAVEWRGEPPSRPKQWDREFDEILRGATSTPEES
jgi:hypothetical protein